MVVLDTPIRRASSEQDVPFFCSLSNCFLFSASIFILGISPFLRPKCFPSCFLRASASLYALKSDYALSRPSVRIKPQHFAVNVILKNVSLFGAVQYHPLFYTRIENSHNLKQRTAEPWYLRNKKESPGRILSNTPDNLRSLLLTLPLTVSVYHLSMLIPFLSAKRTISSRWFSKNCFSVLTLK